MTREWKEGAVEMFLVEGMGMVRLKGEWSCMRRSALVRSRSWRQGVGTLD
jgi:hypothetical protein